MHMIIAALEYAQFTNNDIYLAYIDLQIAFGSVDHVRLLSTHGRSKIP